MKEGSYAYTVTLTDIHIGWTECAALVVREQALVVGGIGHIRRTRASPRTFNSLQAQREACEAFIQSQQGEGLRLVAAAYDGGGFSGGGTQFGIFVTCGMPIASR